MPHKFQICFPCQNLILFQPNLCIKRGMMVKMVTIKSKREIELMREACRVVALTYKKLEEVIRAGMTTWELDQIAEKTMRDLGAIPAEKGYDIGIRGVPKFPASICVSINDEVIHGIPSKSRVIKEGDIVKIGDYEMEWED